MAETTAQSTTLDRLLRATIAEVVERHAQKFTPSRSLESDVRELRAAVSRLERRIASLGRGGPRRRGTAGKGRPGRPALYTHCTVPNCGEEHYALGLCSKHYQQRRRREVTEAIEKRQAKRKAAKPRR